MLFLHGGGYVTASPALYRHLTWRLADAARREIVAIDYRLAPEHPFPAALDDAMTAWRGAASRGADPRRIVVWAIPPAAGWLWRWLCGCAMPDALAAAGIVALSPWTDLAMTGEVVASQSLRRSACDISTSPHVAAGYLAGADPRDPYASPLYGDPSGLPPTLIQVGSDEVLLDNAVRMAERMRAAGCAVELEIWPRMPHVWHAFATIMPEARAAIARIGAFVRQQTAPTDRSAGCGKSRIRN